MRVFENETHPELRKLIEPDRLTFAVPYDVLAWPVKKLVAGDGFLIVHTAPVWPTWIWTVEDITETQLDELFTAICREFMPVTDYRFNTKPEMAEYLIDRLVREGMGTWEKSLEMTTYTCPDPKPPHRQVAGHRELMTDLDLAARMICSGSSEVGDRVLTMSESVESAKEKIAGGTLYLWRDGEGQPAAILNRSGGDYVKLGGPAYTKPEKRGQGIMARLVYETCLEIVGEGKTPILYADAGNPASNKCYQNAGFVPVGTVCTIRQKRLA